MAGGLAALLDDVALIARKAAVQIDDVAAVAGRTSIKSSALVIDDAAVTPSYVTDVSPKRELPIIWRITKGSLINKLVIILPIALLLSWLAPWALAPILMCGGAYLAFEGAEKIWEYLTGHHHEEEGGAAASGGEDALVKSAIRTDLILSAEIMVISLSEIEAESFWMRLAVLIVVGILLTVAVYGVVALIIKMDDVGLALDRRYDGGPLDALGKALVRGMPWLLTVLTIVGTAAMLWVGGHILTSGAADLGWHWPHDVIESLSHAAAGGGGFVVWLVDTACSAVVGFAVGSVITAVVLSAAALRRRSRNEDPRRGPARGEKK